MITKFLQQSSKEEPLTIYGDGEQTRDFICINDIVNALVLTLEAKDVDGEVFNICTGKPTSINQIVEAVHAVTGRAVRVKRAAARAGEIRFSYGDPAKAAVKLKFTAKVSLQEGLKLLLKQ